MSHPGGIDPPPEEEGKTPAPPPVAVVESGPEVPSPVPSSSPASPRSPPPETCPSPTSSISSPSPPSAAPSSSPGSPAQLPTSNPSSPSSAPTPVAASPPAAASAPAAAAPASPGPASSPALPEGLALLSRIRRAKGPIQDPGKVLREGVVSKPATLRTVDRYLVLTSKYILVASLVDKDGLDVRHIFPLAKVQIDERKARGSKSFHLTCSATPGAAKDKEKEKEKEKEYLFTCPSEADRSGWVDAIRAAASGHAGEHSVHIGTLHWAASTGDAQAVRAILAQAQAQGPSLEARDAEGLTPLFLAVRGGHREAAAALLEAKADVTARDAEQQTVLHLAARKGNAEMLAMIASKRPGMDFAPLSTLRKTPLWYAAVLAPEEKAAECIRALLTAGARPDEKDEDTGAPLISIVSGAGRIGPLRALLLLAASHTLPCNRGRTPLHYAAEAGHVPCVQALLSAGALPNLSDHQLNRPLHLATALPVAITLVANGARTGMPNAAGTKAGLAFEPAGQARLSEARAAFERSPPIPLNDTKVVEARDWVKDEVSNACLLCGDNFGFLSRKHHCRVCGFLVCGACSSRLVRNAAGHTLRACDGCYNRLKARESPSRDVRHARDAQSQSQGEGQARVADGKRQGTGRGREQGAAAALDPREELLALDAKEARTKAAGAPSPTDATAASTHSTMQQNRQILERNQERLSVLAERTGELDQHAADFASMARKLREQQSSRWF